MTKYSITLNFFIPERITKELKKVKIAKNSAFDWRKTKNSHCTVKAIAICDEIPKEIESWSKTSEKILSKVKAFKVNIKGIDTFPTAIFAKVHSKELLKVHKKLYKHLPGSQSEFENKMYIPHIYLITAPKNYLKI